MPEVTESIWKIRNPKTGLYWNGRGRWTKEGKAYQKKGHAGGEYSFAGKMELVRFEIVETHKEIIE